MVSSTGVSGSDNGPSKGEWLALIILLLGVLLLNICTYAMYPSVWNDDILWSDPAINLVRTGHFTTSVWQLQPAGAFWAAQSPIYPFALSVWLRMAGFSLLAVRSFNFVLITIGAVLVWVGSWKYQLVKRPVVRLVMVALVLFGYGISFAYRSSRPDVCGLISLVSLGLAFSTKNARRRNVLVFVCALIAPWVGVQIGLYACSAVFLAKLFFREVTWKEVVLVGVAVGLGAAGVLTFYAMNGVLHDFMASLHQAAKEHINWGGSHSYMASVPRRIWYSILAYVLDFSSLPLMAALAITFLFRRNLGRKGRTVSYLLVLFFSIPFIFDFTGHFAFYYSYMLYVPMALAFFIVYSDALDSGDRGFFTRLLFPVCIAGAIAVGLPLRLALCGSLYQLTSRNTIRENIQAHVQPQDVVFSDYTTYFEAKQSVQNVFIPAYGTNFARIAVDGHGFSPEEKKEITVMVVRPEKINELQGYFGGQWEAVSEPFGDSTSLEGVAKVPLVGQRVVHHFNTPQMQRFKVEVFRREPGS